LPPAPPDLTEVVLDELNADAAKRRATVGNLHVAVETGRPLTTNDDMIPGQAAMDAMMAGLRVVGRMPGGGAITERVRRTDSPPEAA
jgi:hypothetical protein